VKAKLSDLTAKDLKRLEEFVTHKTRNIAVLSQSLRLSATHP